MTITSLQQQKWWKLYSAVSLGDVLKSVAIKKNSSKNKNLNIYTTNCQYLQCTHFNRTLHYWSLLHLITSSNRSKLNRSRRCFSDDIMVVVTYTCSKTSQYKWVIIHTNYIVNSVCHAKTLEVMLKTDLFKQKKKNASIPFEAAPSVSHTVTNRITPSVSHNYTVNSEVKVSSALSFLAMQSESNTTLKKGCGLNGRGRWWWGR